MTVAKLTFEDFKALSEFPENILSEIVREGEQKLDAQLSTANAVDQRALGVLGFQITLAIAISGGLATLVNQARFDKPLMILAILVLVGLGCAASRAYLSVLPKIFSYPGNRPDSWLLDDWHLPPSTHNSAEMRFARAEQCFCLYSAIYDNSKIMDENARLLKLSMEIMAITILLAVTLLTLYATFKLLS